MRCWGKWHEYSRDGDTVINLKQSKNEKLHLQSLIWWNKEDSSYSPMAIPWALTYVVRTEHWAFHVRLKSSHLHGEGWASLCQLQRHSLMRTGGSEARDNHLEPLECLHSVFSQPCPVSGSWKKVDQQVVLLRCKNTVILFPLPCYPGFRMLSFWLPYISVFNEKSDNILL